MSIRIAVVPVGGKGARFQDGFQKCLAEIDDKPLLEHLIDSLEEAGIKLIFLLTGHFRDHVDVWLNQRQQTKSLVVSVFGGTKGQITALLKLRNFLREDFLYTPGDCVLLPVSFTAVMKAGERHPDRIGLTLVSRHSEQAPTHPRAALEPTRLIREVIPHDKEGISQPCIIGTYLLRPRVFPYLDKVAFDPSYSLSEFVRYANEKGERVLAIPVREPWFCLHTPEDLIRWQISRLKAALEESLL
jgi:NDP-sugar pyrophosphorylase family protein